MAPEVMHVECHPCLRWSPLESSAATAEGGASERGRWGDVERR